MIGISSSSSSSISSVASSSSFSSVIFSWSDLSSSSVACFLSVGSSSS